MYLVVPYVLLSLLVARGLYWLNTAMFPEEPPLKWWNVSLYSAGWIVALPASMFYIAVRLLWESYRGGDE